MPSAATNNTTHGRTEIPYPQKYTPPMDPAYLLHRKNLNSKLHNTMNFPISYVVAPGGAGKSTAVSHWIRSEFLGLASWINLSQEDNSPLAFHNSLIQGFSIHFQDNLEESQGSDSREDPRFSLSDIVKILAAKDEEIYLILDNFQNIICQHAKEELIHFIEMFPGNAHVVILSRCKPELRDLKWRASGKLFELGSSELFFTEEEVPNLLNNLCGMVVSEEEKADLYQWSGGWPVALVLTGVAFRNSGDSKEKALLMRSDFIRRFLLEEVFHPLDSRVKEFLLRSSMVSKWNTQILEVLKVGEIQETIQLILDKQLFTQVLPTQDQSFQFFPIFRHFLEEHLKAKNMKLWKGLHTKLAQYYLSKGDLFQTMKVLEKQGDTRRSVELIESIGLDFMRNGQWRPLVDWILRIPEDVKKDHPRLLIWQVWAWVNLGKIDRGMTLLEKINPSRLNPMEKCEWKAVVLRTQLYNKGFILSPDKVQETLGCLPEDHPLFGDISAYYFRRIHHYQEAVETFNKGVEWGKKTENQTFAMVQNFYRSWILIDLGELALAEELSKELLQWVEQKGGTPSWIHLALGLIYYERNSLALAESHLESALSAGESSGELQLSIYGISHLMLVKSIRGKKDEAHSLGDKALGLSQNQGAEPMHYNLRERNCYAQYREAISTGEYIHLPHLVENQKTFDEPRSWGGLYEILGSLLTKEGLSQGMGKEIKRLETRLAFFREKNLKQCIVREGMILSYAYLTQGDRDKFQRQAGESLTTALKGGFIRSCVDLTPSFDIILQNIQGLSLAIPYMKALEEAFYIDKREASRETNPLSVKISLREKKILLLMNQGLSNKEMAAQLFIAVSTVKWHLKNLYAKFQVKSRTAALAKAKSLGVIS